MNMLPHTLLLVAAITTSSVINAATPSLEETEWMLDRYSDASGMMKQALPKSPAYAKFSGGKLYGSAGCNSYSGQYHTTEGNLLTISDRIVATMMACAPAVSQQEQQFLSLLPAVKRAEISEKTLLLLNAESRVILQFVVQSSATLENNNWQARGVNNGKGGVVSSKSTHLVTARFEAGTLSGNAGCNNYSAPYTVAGENLTIGAARATRRLCARPGVMEQEQQFFQALQQTRTFQLGRDRLELRNEKGSLLVRFTNQGL